MDTKDIPEDPMEGSIFGDICAKAADFGNRMLAEVGNDTHKLPVVWRSCGCREYKGGWKHECLKHRVESDRKKEEEDG